MTGGDATLRLAVLAAALCLAAPAQAAGPEDEGAGERSSVWDNFGPHEPIYGLLGANPADAKVQFSLRYRLFDNDTGMPDALAWIKKIHLAYTQTSFWDLSRKSAPFTDNIFHPELLYRTRLSRGKQSNASPAIRLQAGLSHKSNGQGDVDSRSFNTLYVEPEFNWGQFRGLQFSLAPRARLYVGKLADNPDIARFRGHGALRARLGRADGWQVAAHGRLGDHLDKGSVAIDLSYPVDRLIGGGPEFYLHTQLFTGYGENLLRFDQKVTRLRFGISLIR